VADPTRIRTQWGAPIDDEEYEYYAAIVRHLEATLGPWLTLEDYVALIPLLDLYDFRYSDGLEFSNEVGCLGMTGGAQIAACFTKDPSVDFGKLKLDYLYARSSDPCAPIHKRMDNLMTRILADPTVTLLDGPYVPHCPPSNQT
jgi:hypothetical protein